MSIPTRGFEVSLDRLVVRGHDVYEGQDIVNTIETTHWAARRDFTARDRVAYSDIFNTSSFETRFYVRADTPWVRQDGLTSEGERFAVRGISRVGARGQYLELLVRGIH